ncbi:WecB/TagA/CpsF family glycosyltransferase [Nocardioides sp.]|uniref:WecB/TagA/CpsF family glycosyltransferase n=1 Tax=Nocardioides sp. TaxID=35761 RepID=UPI00262B95A6|nr:WecB/TagA/CpsF family glycosyltransferase [Nocardioides sp.]
MVERRFLGPWRLPVDPYSAEEIVAWVNDPTKTGTITGCNLHSLYLYCVDPVFRRVYDKSAVSLADGSPIAWLASLAFRKRVQKVGSTDWLRILPPSRAPIVVIGGSPSVNAEFCRQLHDREVGTSGIEGIDGYDGLAELLAGRHPIGGPSAEANLVIVGLGMPLQEHLEAKFRAFFPRSKIALVGGALDQLVGYQQLAPAWMRSSGLEWMWRLVRDPKRLAYRYLIEPLKLPVATWRLLRERRASS